MVLSVGLLMLFAPIFDAALLGGTWLNYVIPTTFEAILYFCGVGFITLLKNTRKVVIPGVVLMGVAPFVYSYLYGITWRSGWFVSLVWGVCFFSGALAQGGALRRKKQ